MEDKFFSLDEVSKYLNIPKSTIYKLSQRGILPSVKIGKQLRFRKSSIDSWFSEKESKEVFLKTGELISTKPRYILLVDDDTLVLKTVSKFLNTCGYNVEAVQSGEEALKRIEKLNFDLIIADIRMPGIDGIETIKRIREFSDRYNKPLIPEIIITAYMDIEAERQAKSLGIKDYIYKPFIASEFIKIVKERIN